MLKTLYDHFSELYSEILKINPSLPAEHALAQEEEVYNKSTKLTYRNVLRSPLENCRFTEAIHTQAVIQSVSALKKRPKPTSIKHDSVGTDGMIKEKQEKAQRLRSLQLSRKHLQPYIMSLDEMKKWGYIVEIPDGPGGMEPSLVGKTKQCERCNQHYLVKSGLEASRNECRFHWGRPYTARINGA
jgi:RNA exonuclease 1